MIIVKDRKSNKYISIDRPLTDDEIAQKRKITYVIRKQEELARQEYNLEHRNGYCPHCHMLIPLNGQCECGYEIRR